MIDMGVTIHYVGRKQKYRSLDQNLDYVTKLFPLTDGFFGIKGSTFMVREIHSKNHEVTAKMFFNAIAKGGILDLRTINGGVISHLKDGSIISYRKISKSPNSPAVEIRFRSVKSKYGVKDQKIHFVQD